MGTVVRSCCAGSTCQRPATVFSGLLAPRVARHITLSCSLLLPLSRCLRCCCRMSSLCCGLCSQFVQFAGVDVVIVNLAQLIPSETVSFIESQKNMQDDKMTLCGAFARRTRGGCTCRSGQEDHLMNSWRDRNVQCDPILIRKKNPELFSVIPR